MKAALAAPIVAAALALTAPAALPAHAEPGGEQGDARRDIRERRALPLREIEARVLPTMPGMQYIGPEYDSAAMAYRLKFIHNGRVVFVDVDARTGRVLGQSR